ncbi:MAG: hypothetical protein Q9222_003547 [Ikaeria aurantiellina]
MDLEKDDRDTIVAPDSDSISRQRKGRSSHAAGDQEGDASDMKDESHIQGADGNGDLHSRGERRGSLPTIADERIGHHETEENTLKRYQSIEGAGSRQANGHTRSRRDNGPGSSKPSLQHSRSYGDGHGFVCFSDDEDHTEEARRQGNADEKDFEVQWDGDNDPMNPRSMSKARKWSIVLIVSSSSTCVYVLNLFIMIWFGRAFD